ncbi:MAG TPA: sigma 54-interacting transcriptional regulator [Clostridium sp.]|uniref:sigma-54-dependent Fis family transcriptional regulator n=1 Tax=Clostridium sp. TaxID=1506 RepID=UPI002F927E16
MNIIKNDINKAINVELLGGSKTKLKNQKDYILRGWKRCVESGISPFEVKCAKKYEGKELETILYKNIKLIYYAKPYMEDLYSFVKGTGFTVVLSDANACILELMCDNYIIENSEDKINFVKGAVWDELYVGNNSINTSLKEGIPIQISGDEHYCIMNKDWTCSSAPIRKEGKIIGAIGVRGYMAGSHAHTLGMIVVAAKAIETRIEIEHTKAQLKIKNKFQNAIVESSSDGILTIDASGIVTSINTSGAEILEVNRENSIGKHISNIVDFDPVILNVLKSGKGYVDKEFILKNRKGTKFHFIKTATIIRDGHGNIIGVVDTFRKIKRVQTMVTKMVGAYGKFHFDDIIGSSNIIKESIRLAKIAAKSSSTILVQGECGTGKELIVQSIHNASSRKNECFISINCAAIPNELIESELFGYNEGSFTGALKGGNPGKFELAKGGTIFLDEIGDMPLYMQAKLLRVLQEKQITRIGGNDVIDIDVRVICATNKELFDECNKGNFRRDLYYRVNVLNIYLPPLRLRKEDIKEIVYYFISKMNVKIDKSIKAISDEAMEYIMNYEWPGNVRELENCIERAINLCQGDIIGLKDLATNIREKKRITNLEKDLFNDSIPLGKNPSEDKLESLETIEIKEIKKVLYIMDGNISKTANVLKVSRNTLYNKMKKYSLKM